MYIKSILKGAIQWYILHLQYSAVSQLFVSFFLFFIFFVDGLFYRFSPFFSFLSDFCFVCLPSELHYTFEYLKKSLCVYMPLCAQCVLTDTDPSSLAIWSVLFFLLYILQSCFISLLFLFLLLSQCLSPCSRFCDLLFF